jgi:hypothetical protein
MSSRTSRTRGGQERVGTSDPKPVGLREGTVDDPEEAHIRVSSAHGTPKSARMFQRVNKAHSPMLVKPAAFGASLI